MTTILQAKRQEFMSLNAGTSTSYIASAPKLSLYNEAIFFKLSSLLNASVITNVMASRQVQTGVVRKFTGRTAIGILPSVTSLTGYVVFGNKEYAGPRTQNYGISRALLEVTVCRKCRA